MPRTNFPGGGRGAASAALTIVGFAVLAFSANASLQTIERGAPGTAGLAGREVFDDPFDGVWVGILNASVAGSKRPYPVLLNLNVRSTGGDGLILLADNLAGAPSHLDFLPIAVQAKGKKLTLTAITDENWGTRELAATLRLKGDVLKGTLTSSDEGFKKSRLELRRFDAEQPLQQLWSGTLPTARGTELVALTFWISGSVSGGGFVGTAFGNLASATVVNGRLTGLLSTDDGDIELDLTIGRDGQLGGFVDGRPLDDTPLAPGATSRTPTIRKLKPASLPVGVTTEVAIKGKNLAPGFLVDTDIEGVYAGVPQVLSAKKASVAVTVAADVAPGTSVQLTVMAANGEALVTKAKLATSGVAAVSFLGDLLPILTGTCASAGCHVQPPPDDDPAYPTDDGPAGPAGGLDLSASLAFSNLVNKPSIERPELDRIEPFDPERSYLIKKLLGDPDILGDRMPQDGPPYLSPEMIDMFVRWVEAGALRN